MTITTITSITIIITTSGFGKQTVALFEFYIRFRFWPISRHPHVVLP